MAAITCELKWLKGLLLSLGVQHSKAIKLFCDSQSALHIARNPVSMNGQNILRLIVTLSVMRLLQVLLILHMFLLILNWPTFSLRHSGSRNLTFCCPSWASLLRLLQLEGGVRIFCDNIWSSKECAETIESSKLFSIIPSQSKL